MKNKLNLLIFLISCLSSSLYAQVEVEEALDRAAKQYDLYAFQMAMTTYKDVLKIAPNNGFAYARIGDCLVQLNQPEQALLFYEKAVGKPDVPANFPLRYGKALMNVGNYAKAKRWFELFKSEDRYVSEHFASVCDYATANSGVQPLYLAKNEAINTTSSDFSPKFYGERVVFSSSRTDMRRSAASGKSQVEAGASKNQLYLTKIDDKTGMLQAPVFLRSDLQNTYNEGPASFAPLAGKVAFCRNNFVDGNRQIAANGVNMSLYIADFVDGQWINIKAFPYNGSDFATGFPSITPDGKTLYFSSTRPNGYGGWDLYSSSWDGQQWAPPVNLGKEINTSGDEVTPYPDGNTFYFSSDFHPGFGGLDVFKAVRGADGQYSQLVHLGPGINSSMDDYGFIYDSRTNTGYLTSNRSGGKGEEDIWRITKRTEDFAISVEDAQGKPIEGAKIDLSDCGGEIYATNAKGIYDFEVTYGQTNCKFKVSKQGYSAVSGSLVSGKATKVKVKLQKEEMPVEASVKTETKATSTKKNEDLGSMVFKTKQEEAKTGTSSSKEATTEIAEAPITHSTAKETKTKGESPIVAEIVKTETMTGYSVQLAAALIGGKEKLDENSFASFNEFGHVYSTKEGKYLKIKVGVYATEAEAESALKRIIKKGQKDVFVSVEKNISTELLYKVPTEVEEPLMANVISKSSTATTKGAATKPVESSAEKAANAPTKAEDLVFAVQLASITNSGHAIDMSPFMDLTVHGNLYSVPDSVFTKIRLGVWSSYDAAEEAKELIVKKGFKDAILVPEKAVYLTKKILIKDKEVEKTPASTSKGDKDAKADVKKEEKSTAPITHSNKTTPKQVEVSKANDKAVSPYFVQLASLTNAKGLDVESLEKLGGTVYMKKSGKMTLVYLKDFENLEAAINAKNKARNSGFKDAFVVKKEKDAFVKIKL